MLVVILVTGVNRRTAVLFTRKAQSAAAFSNLRIPQRPELSALSQSPSPSAAVLGSGHTQHLLGNGNEATLDCMCCFFFFFYSNHSNVLTSKQF